MKRKKPTAVKKSAIRKRRSPLEPKPAPSAPCEICRKPMLFDGNGVPIHALCRSCPQCNESFTFVYLRAQEGAYLRCLHCMHLWNGQPVTEPLLLPMA